MNKEEIIKHDINLLLIDNALEQNRLNFETKKEEIYKNKLQEKDKKLERYKNIIDELERYIKTEAKIEIYGDKTGLRTFVDGQDLLDKLKELKGE